MTLYSNLKLCRVNIGVFSGEGSCALQQTSLELFFYIRDGRTFAS